MNAYNERNKRQAIGTARTKPAGRRLPGLALRSMCVYSGHSQLAIRSVCMRVAHKGNVGTRAADGGGWMSFRRGPKAEMSRYCGHREPAGVGEAAYVRQPQTKKSIPFNREWFSFRYSVLRFDVRAWCTILSYQVVDYCRRFSGSYSCRVLFYLYYTTF